MRALHDSPGLRSIKSLPLYMMVYGWCLKTDWGIIQWYKLGEDYFTTFNYLSHGNGD
ncbi:hypothetical protein LCGC14_0714120 [marine sediment metagenome]|uniref:Uncharacterized protein n=1 Tax=marine sediment metagenome TaxID=412755 RepID=A0A0F9QIQ0_9ZZZZ